MLLSKLMTQYDAIMERPNDGLKRLIVSPIKAMSPNLKEPNADLNHAIKEGTLKKVSRERNNPAVSITDWYRVQNTEIRRMKRMKTNTAQSAYPSNHSPTR